MARELQIIDFCTVTMKVGYKAFFPNSSVTICSNWSNLVKILTQESIKFENPWLRIIKDKPNIVH